MKKLGLYLCVALSLAAQVRELPVPPRGASVADSYIVTFRAGTSASERAASIARAGASVRFQFDIINGAAVRVPNANALAALQRDTAVARISPDYVVTALAKPGTGGGGAQGQVVPEGVKRVGVSRTGSDGAGIGVAIVDTGIDLAQSDLAVSTQRFDAYGGTCQDGDGHGTHVAGIVAALNNSTGVIGVAPAATPYCVRVLDNSGSGSDAAVIAGLNWVFTNRNLVTPSIRVVNMSLGREKVDGDMSGSLRAAVKALYDAGVIVVVAAGNDGSKEVKDMMPAGLPEVLAVASTTAKDGSNSCRWLPSAIKRDTASYFSTDGALAATADGLIGVTTSSPGEDQENVSKGCFLQSSGILSLKSGGGTVRYSGTSMASPHVAGIVARVLQKGFAATPEQVRNWLRNNEVSGVPLASPSGSYTDDGEKEGVALAP